MLRTLLDNPVYLTLPDAPHDGNSSNPWHTLIELALGPQVGASAVIDSGALTVGASNREVASYIWQHLDWYRFDGVIFFYKETNSWAIMDRRAQVLPTHIAFVHERNCFAFFDESRARGSDLKLPQQAKAVVTIGPNMTKDKLMQASGRMRLLDAGQTLVFVGTAEITMNIRRVDQELMLEEAVLDVQRSYKRTAADKEDRLTARVIHHTLASEEARYAILTIAQAAASLLDARAADSGFKSSYLARVAAPGFAADYRYTCTHRCGGLIYLLPMWNGFAPSCARHRHAPTHIDLSHLCITMSHRALAMAHA